MTPDRSAIVEDLRVSAFDVPTDAPESDATLEWDSVTLVLVEARSRGKTGLGFTYGHPAVASLVDTKLSGVVAGCDAFDVRGASERMRAEVRNLGGPGMTALAMSAVDNALWDLKARLLDVPLVKLLGQVRDACPVYGSGGFTSYSVAQLGEQLAGWVEKGVAKVKIKVARHPSQDPERLRVAREAIGNSTELFVDANGAFKRKDALRWAERYAGFGVRWFEEPLSSDDLEGLRLMRDRAPAAMDIAAGEYGYDVFYFRRMLEAGAVDVLQADVTRCGGTTGFLDVAALCRSHNMNLSSHTAPAMHAHLCCALPEVVHMEYFHTHARAEKLLFDGPHEPEQGTLRPSLSRPGNGLALKRSDAEKYLAYAS